MTVTVVAVRVPSEAAGTLYIVTLTGTKLSPSVIDFFASSAYVPVCAKASPAPSANTTPNRAIHFNALQLPLAKVAPVRMSQSPL